MDSAVFGTRRFLSKVLTHSEERKQMSLKKMLITGLGIWSVCFYLVHGPAVFAYMGIMASTAGLFVWSVAKKLKVR